MKKTLGTSILFYTLSFTVPAILIMAALAGLKVTPFGDETLAISDGNALYLNYLGYVGRAVKGQESLLFSFEKGLGGNMMGSWGWFLLNPFFALFAIFDLTNYMKAFTYVSVLNFCACGLTMYILLRDIYGHRLDNLIFSTAYALNGFLVANVFQMNFFVCIPVLPIMVMGIRRILKNENPLIYILSIAYSLLMNFYFGFILCTASFLIFTICFVSNRDHIEDKKAIITKYIVSSVIGGFLAAVVWLPALLSLRGGRLDQNISNSIVMRENMPFLDMFSKLFTGANTTNELRNGLPNIFVGILPVFLVILFFTNKGITKRRKTTAAIILIVYLVSFYVAVFNIIMHGGTVTNWFNYRDSFVFSFLMLMIAAEEWRNFTDEPVNNLKKASLILIVATLVVFSKQYEFVTGTAVMIDFAVLAVMFLAYWMHKKDPARNTKKAFTLVVLVMMCLNLFLNYYISTKNIQEWGKTEPDYQKTVAPVGALVESVQNTDSDFYRMEIGEQLSGVLGNDPMLYGYYGVGHGGSDDRDFVRTALSKLGIRRFDMRNSYSKGIPAAADTLLGLKYIVSKEDLVTEKDYERLVDLGEWILYKNPNTLPVAFAANASVNDVELEFTDVFENLNQTWSALTGSEDVLFAEERDVIFTSHNYCDPNTITGENAYSIVSEKDAKLDKQTSSSEAASDEKAESLMGKSSDDESSSSDSYNFEYMVDGSLAEPMENSSYIEYTIKVHRDGPVYSYNRSGMMDENGSILPAMIYEGYYHEGDTIKKYLPMTTELVPQYVLEDVAGRFRVAYANTDALKSMSSTIMERPSEIERITDSHLRGTVNLEEGQELFFTIPFDEGWRLTVDGKPVTLKKVLDVFMAAELEPGEHRYEMKFVPTGLKLGAYMAIVAVVLLIPYLIVDRKRRHTLSNK